MTIKKSKAKGRQYFADAFELVGREKILEAAAAEGLVKVLVCPITGWTLYHGMSEEYTARQLVADAMLSSNPDMLTRLHHKHLLEKDPTYAADFEKSRDERRRYKARRAKQ